MPKKMIVDRVLNPFWSVVFFAFIALLAILGLPQNIAAYIICTFFLVIVILHPVNGIYFLLLVVPFFLGNSKRPYYLTLEFFVYATLFSAILHWLVRKRTGRTDISPVPYVYPVLLFLAVSVCSLPLNFKELLWEIWACSPGRLLRILGSSHEGYNLYPVRRLLNFISAVLLYFVAVSSTMSSRGVPKAFGTTWQSKTSGTTGRTSILSVPATLLEPDRIFKAMAVIALVTIIFGLLFLYGVVPHSGRYLSLSLVGVQKKAMTAFAYNRGYLAQYLIVTLPLIAFFLSGWRNHKAFSLAFSFIVITCISGIALTYQRGPILTLMSQVLLFLVLYWYVSDRKRRSLFLSFGIIIGILTILLVTDHFFLGGRGLHRLLTRRFDSARWQLWKTAWQMFKDNPLLGIGIGKHHYFFPHYCKLAGIPWRKFAFLRTNACHVYLYLLAEQGIIGLGCFIFLIGRIFTDIFKKLKVMTQEHRAVAIAITVSLFGWLVFGLSENMFYVRSMQVFFWIMLGLLTVILRTYIKPTRISKKTLIVTSICLLLLFSYRIFVVAKYPLPEKYYVGFYDWETQPDGTKAHWMGKRGAMRIPVEGKELVLKCKAALPDLNLRPQMVYITTNEGYSRDIVLNDNGCVEIEIPVGKRIGEFVWVKFRVDYVIVPFEEGWSKDSRALGVMMYDARWER